MECSEDEFFACQKDSTKVGSYTFDNGQLTFVMDGKTKTLLPWDIAEKYLWANYLNKACRNYRIDVAAGTTNSANPNNVTANTLPDNTATDEERAKAAAHCTVAGAVEFAALDSVQESVDNGDFVYDKNGTIYPKHEHPAEEGVYTVLKSDTVLGEGGLNLSL